MEASINFDGTLSGAISGGGGGGGSDVVITPVVTSGTKIADVSVNGVEKDLYCPSPTVVEVSQVQQSGTKIASIEVNGQSVDLYAPTPSAPTEIEVTQIQQSGTKIASIEVNGVGTDLYAPEGGSIEYSTTEKIIGKWVDNRDVYQIVINLTMNNTSYELDVSDLDIDIITKWSGFIKNSNNEWILHFPYYDGPNYFTVGEYNRLTKKMLFVSGNSMPQSYPYITIILEYVKNVQN